LNRPQDAGRKFTGEDLAGDNVNGCVLPAAPDLNMGRRCRSAA
jgi:hypothetical protein